jgi:hypothetical protein
MQDQVANLVGFNGALEEPTLSQNSMLPLEFL